MYFVDREKMDDMLLYLEKQISLFEEINEWTSKIELSALERLTQMMIESILDVGNSIIDGFIMRDPGSYDDIIDILEDEKVITTEMSKSYKQIIPFRKNLQQLYTNINHDELVKAFQKELSLIKLFAPSVRDYMIKELGPVTAFKPYNKA